MQARPVTSRTVPWISSNTFKTCGLPNGRIMSYTLRLKSTVNSIRETTPALPIA